MSQEVNNVTPSRQMSGRRSKPSMELLVDNQRILSQYIVPSKEKRLRTPKQHLDNVSLSNNSELSSISSKEKSKPKYQQRKSNVKSKEENISPKILIHKRKIVNGSKSALEDGNSNTNNKVISRSPYATLKIKKLEMKQSDKVVEEIDIKGEDDDLPLSKVFPDFKPNVADIPIVAEKRSIIVLPPKKKIKFVNINELNGSVVKKPLSPLVIGDTVVSEDKLKLGSPSKSDRLIATKNDVHALPKIPKKSTTNIVTIVVPHVSNGSVTSQDHVTDVSKIQESSGVITSNHTQTSATTSEKTPSPNTHRTLNTVTPRRCVRHTCTNVAIDDHRWHHEFCSADCAVIHTKNIFSDWLVSQHSADVMAAHLPLR